MNHAADLRAVGDRIESLLQEVGAVADSRVQSKAEELVRLLMEFYGAGLERILEIVGADEAGERLLQLLAADEVVAAQLVLHDLHPVDVGTRIERALEELQPAPGSPFTGIELVGLEDGVVRLRLQGKVDGRSHAAISLRHSVERALQRWAPEVTGLEIEGLDQDPSATAPHLVQLQPLARSAAAGGPG